MARFVALLRGVNVSGHRPIAMAGLRRSLDALGLAGVRTYLQSGNVVFDADQREAQGLALAIQTKVAADFGHAVEVVVLSCVEMARIASSNPFVPAPSVHEKWLHVTVLFEPGPEAGFASLTLPAAAGEQAVREGRAVYLYLPNGYGRTKLTNAYFERAFGVAATTRNWRTVQTLAGLCEGH
jgi:uncharacterized protein (DUF1697 family)